MVLPTEAPYEVRFPKTTDYHWATFSDNATVELLPGDFEQVEGPFGFGKAVQMDEERKKCMYDTDFANDNDNCTRNPINCKKGVSISLFYKNIDTVKPEDMVSTAQFPRKYILSTGGEGGSPGISIFLEGPEIGATLSTGVDTWTVKVLGNMPKNNSWNNIAVRWEPIQVDNDTHAADLLANNNNDLSALGGLQLFLNLVKVGHSVNPDCQEDETCPAKEDPLDPPTVMIGCHKTKNDDGYKGFLSGAYDEVAYWTRRIPDNETQIFLGGYKDSFESIDASALVNMMNGVDLNDPNQADAAINVMGIVLGGAVTKSTPFRNIFPTTPLTPKPAKAAKTTTTKAPEKETTTTSKVESTTTTTDESKVKARKSLMGLIDVMNKMTNPGAINDTIYEKEFRSRIKVAKLLGNFVNKEGKNGEGWELLNKENDQPGAHRLRENLETFLKKAATQLYSRSLTTSEIQGGNSFTQIVKFSSTIFRRLKSSLYRPETLTSDKGEKVKTKEAITFPLWRNKQTNGIRSKRSTAGEEAEDRLEKWESLAESIQIPVNMFSGSCVEKDVAIIGSVYDSFPDPGRKNPVFIRAKRIKLDSRVVSVAALANKWDTYRGKFSPSPPCKPDKKLLLRERILINMPTLTGINKKSSSSTRKLLFHENEGDISVIARHCAIWNSGIGTMGAWDTQHIQTVSVDEDSAVCVTTKMGTYAIIAELREEPTVDPDLLWLRIVKYVGYAISLVLLVIFIVIIILSAYLWEQFHILRLNLSLAVIIGHLGMISTEFQYILEDRHLCTAAGGVISFGYTAAALFLAAESHATFKAFTGGIILGRSRVYIPIAWGGSILALGYNIFFGLEEMGNDPRCLLSWENQVKWNFFIPVLSAAGVSLTVMVVLLCNIATPAMRKQSIVEELSSIFKGLLGMVFLFSLTWAWAPLAYIDYPDLDLPDFYPSFQVMNSWMGVFVFVLLGACSTRFRHVVAGTVKNRQQMVLDYAKQSSSGGKLPQDDDDDNVSVKTDKSTVP